MNIKDELLKYELVDSKSSYLKKEGILPIIITAPHTIKQKKTRWHY